MLILGGRYGSIEPSSKKSYIQIEYEYALNQGIPLFALVIKDETLRDKVKSFGQDVLELDNPDGYKNFKQIVLSKMCKFFEDTKDIRIAVHETLVEFQNRFEFTGWVSGKDLPQAEKLLEENLKLVKENVELKSKLETEKQIRSSQNLINGIGYNEIKTSLSKLPLKIPEKLVGKSGVTISVLDLFIVNLDNFATGVTNAYVSSDLESFLFYHVAPRLMIYHLVEEVKVSGVKYQRIRTSKEGLRFLAIYEQERLKEQPTGTIPQKVPQKRHTPKS